MIGIVAFFVVGNIIGQTIYYVSTTGSDGFGCGTSDSPCASLNQVLLNYPSQSFTIQIDDGIYNSTIPLALLNNAYVVFQGTGNTTINASWNVGSFVVNSINSGFEFRDVCITLSGGGSSFSTLNTALNNGSFYNVVLTYANYTNGDFIDVNGGNLVINNLTLDGASFDSYVVSDQSVGDNSSVLITGSTFTNLDIGEDGALLVFDAYGSANITLNSSCIANISAGYVFIGFWAEDTNQQIQITNNIFNNTYTYLPSIYIENDNQCVILVQNTTWNNATADFVAAALETLGPDTDTDHDILLDSLSFTACNGPYAGALLVGYNSLNLSNSYFGENVGDIADDVVQALDGVTSAFTYQITNSFSDSHLPKAVVWNLDDDSITDISDQLPFPSAEPKLVHRKTLTRKDISAVPKFGRKARKNLTK